MWRAPSGSAPTSPSVSSRRSSTNGERQKFVQTLARRGFRCVAAHCPRALSRRVRATPVRSARLSGQADAMASRLPPRVRGCRYTLACTDQMIRTAVRSSRAPVLPPPADEVTCYPRRQRRRGPSQRLSREAGRGRLERSGGPRRRCQRLVIIPARQRVVAIAGWNYQKPIRGAK